MAERLTVSGARGASATEIARKTGSWGVLPTDSDGQALTKFADAAIQQNPGFKGDQGDTGPADNTYTSLTGFKASDTTRKTASLVGASGVGDGRFNWTPGDFSGVAAAQLDVNVIKANSTPLSQGAWVRQLGEQALARTFGAKGDGVANDAPAIMLGLAAVRELRGTPGDVYALNTTVNCPSDRALVGNGASLLIAPGIIGGVRLDNDRCTVRGWTIIGSGGGYAVLNTGRFNKFTDNVCRGNIGHFFFSTGAFRPTAFRNTVEGLTADGEITTAIVFENCIGAKEGFSDYDNIPVGWAIQVRDGSSDFTVGIGSTFMQTQYSDEKTATASQKVFTFTLASAINTDRVPVRIHVNGKPLSPTKPDGSVVYTISGSGSRTTFTITFSAGRAAGEKIKLIGYRGAENIQINTGSFAGVIDGFNINGTADSGIVVHGAQVAIPGGKIRNAGFAGIAIYGDQDLVTIGPVVITNCAQMDDGLSSPDNPAIASPFACAILASGVGSVIGGVVFNNSQRTMRSAIRVNKTDMELRTDGSSAITISACAYDPREYVDGPITIPNQDAGFRANSIAIPGQAFPYPAQIDLDQAWTNVPPSTPYYTNAYNGGTGAIRDTAVKLGGTASLKTVEGQYVDFGLAAASIFNMGVVTLTFEAKVSNPGDISYVDVFTVLDGLSAAMRVPVVLTGWKRYSMSFPLTPKLADTILLRIGSVSGSGNFQFIHVSGQKL